MINVTNVGHVVLKVKDLERSVRFYRDVLGLKEVARATFDRPMAFFSATGENHHDIGLFEVGPDAAPPEKNHVGLYHVALRIGHSLEALRGAMKLISDHRNKLDQLASALLRNEVLERKDIDRIMEGVPRFHRSPGQGLRVVAAARTDIAK